MILDVASPWFGLQWSWLASALALVTFAVTISTFRAVARAANPVLGWCLTLLGLVSAVWTASSTYSARIVPIPDPTLRRPYIKCYTRQELDWSSECGQRYADWLTVSIVPSLLMIVLLLAYRTWLVRRPVLSRADDVARSPAPPAPRRAGRR